MAHSTLSRPALATDIFNINESSDVPFARMGSSLLYMKLHVGVRLCLLGHQTSFGVLGMPKHAWFLLACKCISVAHPLTASVAPSRKTK